MTQVGDVKEVKPGVKSTEFWVIALTQLTGLAATVGAFSPVQADIVMDVVSDGEQYVNQSIPVIKDLITRAIGLITMLGSAFGYANSRAKVKGGV